MTSDREDQVDATTPAREPHGPEADPSDADASADGSSVPPPARDVPAGETQAGSEQQLPVDAGGSSRYEILFDCRDRMLGGRLLSRIEDVIGPTFPVQRGEEGTSWSLTIEFPDPAAADRFFDSDFYRQFCIEVRRAARSSVLVVPHG